MKKTELTINDTIMAAMALKFIGDTGAFKRIDLYAEEGRSADAAEIEEITELYALADQPTVFDAFKTTEAFTHFMVNHVFEGNSYGTTNGCSAAKAEDPTEESQQDYCDTPEFEKEFKGRTAEAIVFLMEENEAIKEELKRLESHLKIALQLFVAKGTEK